MLKLISVTTLLVIVGCRATTSTVIDTKSSNPHALLLNTIDTTVSLSSRVRLECDSLVQTVRLDELDWVHLEQNILNCIIEKGYHGNRQYNELIANTLLINHSLEKVPMFLTMVDITYLRGPEVFEAILSTADDHSPRRGFDGELTGLTMSQARQSLAMKMIENIDGLESNTYLDRHSGLSYEERAEAATEFPMYTLSRLYIKLLREAWQEGKIKLKPYGQY